LAASGATEQDTHPDGALRIASGPSEKIYEFMVRDIQAVCGGEENIRNLLRCVPGTPTYCM
jgi:hypothetical protein